MKRHRFLAVGSLLVYALDDWWRAASLEGWWRSYYDVHSPFPEAMTSPKPLLVGEPRARGEGSRVLDLPREVEMGLLVIEDQRDEPLEALLRPLNLDLPNLHGR